MRPTKVSQKGINLIKYFEEFRSAPYLCSAGVPTIGYGTTFYPNGQRVTMSDPPINEEWAEQLLLKNLVYFEASVDSYTRDDINQNQFDALVSFTYNVGVNNFRYSTLLKRVNNNPNDPDITRQFSRWIRAEGKVLKGLVKRRTMEAQLYFSG
jgi:lysozyme